MLSERDIKLILCRKLIVLKVRNPQCNLVKEVAKEQFSTEISISRHVIRRAVRDEFQSHWKRVVAKENTLKGNWPIDEEKAMQDCVKEVYEALSYVNKQLLNFSQPNEGT